MYDNWYVMQVKVGKEEKVANKCLSLTSRNLLHDCIVLKYQYKKRYLGSWHILEKILFPGYVFIIADNIEELYVKLEEIPEFTRLLKKKDLLPIPKEEVNYLMEYSKNNVVEMSYGYISDNHLNIFKGPLKGHEKQIKKVDRHKRLAYLDVDLLHATSKVKMGLEIIYKN